MKKFRIVALLLVMCLASSCFVGGTFAKYASEATGSATANIAKWSVKFETEDIVNLNTDLNISDLIGTIVDTYDDGAQTRALGTHVKDADVIAPGTKGEFEITVVNESEVAADFEFTIEAGQGSPITYNTVAIANTTTGNESNDNLVSPDATVTYTVSWEWEFTDSDDNTYAGQQFTSTVEFTATQVD